jgi:hypothetical protein
VHVELSYGWTDILSDPIDPSAQRKKWLPGDMVSLFFHRFAQPFPIGRLRVFDCQMYDILIEGTLESESVRRVQWVAQTNDARVVCFPVCKNAHWTLIVGVRADETQRVYSFDSLNDEIPRTTVAAKYVGKFLSAPVKTIKVPRQSNGCDCGVHAISHFITIMKIMNLTEDTNLVQAIETCCFDKVLTRAELHQELQDALHEALYERAYWGKCKLLNEEWFWWPCRRVSPAFGEKLGVSLGNGDPTGILVAWYARTVNDMVYLQARDVLPLSEMTADDAMDACKYEDDEAQDLVIAYREASL